MKILGYIDDAISWFINWQGSLGNWNFVLIPIEIIVGMIIFIYLREMFRTKPPFAG